MSNDINIHKQQYFMNEIYALFIFNMFNKHNSSFREVKLKMNLSFSNYLKLLNTEDSTLLIGE